MGERRTTGDTNLAGHSEAAAAVASTLKAFEQGLEHEDTLKVVDYIRLLEGRRETLVDVPAKITLGWVD